MPLFDLPLSELRQYRSSVDEPPGLDGFWTRAIEEARSPPHSRSWSATARIIYRDLEAYDVTFSGADGDPVKAWYLRPAGSGAAELPCRVTFVGYGGGRDLPTAHALYPACGYATFVMDTRAQGGTWSRGDTADPGGGRSAAEHPGVMSRGITSPETYYYRRLYVDAVRAVETAASLAGVDAGRIAVAGISQGGGLALASAALLGDRVRLCHADVPFLCDIERGMDLAVERPYTELVSFLAVHPELEDATRDTLRHIDNALLATRIRARTLISVGLRDTIVPPSTVFAAFNAIRAPKDLVVMAYTGHGPLPGSLAERQLAEFGEVLG